ncbi:MAG: hypothetical protein J7K22_04310 [Nanoarchaeota archaeon]|nr:hypothetical protein [Nanoarchaeota archaeon]
MKKVFFALIFILAFSIANARSLEIKIDKDEVAANSELNIEYRIALDEVETFSYEIGIKGENVSLVLFNKTATTDEETGVISWNTKNYPAGKYEAYIFIYPATYWPSKKFDILPYMDFEISKSVLDFFVYKDELLKTITIKNTGNVPIFVATSLKGLKSQAVLTPITARLDVNKSQNFLLSVKKPKEHYNATLTFEIEWGDVLREISIPVRVYNPIVSIELENISQKREGNNYTLTFTILNNGNVGRNLTFTFKLASGLKEDFAFIKPGESKQFIYSFKSSVRTLEIKFIGSDGKEKVIRKNFGIFSILTFDKNMLYAAIIIILLIGIVYAIKRKKKLPEEIDVSKLGVKHG